MANSVAAVYIDDELAVPKVLKAAHRFWTALPMVNVPIGVRVLCVKVMHDRGAPGSPSTFTDIYSGHDTYGLSFLPGMVGTGLTIVQHDMEGGGTGKLAKGSTRTGALDGVGDTGLTVIETSLIDPTMAGMDIVLISYDVNESDFSALLDEAFEFPLPPAT